MDINIMGFVKQNLLYTVWVFDKYDKFFVSDQ